MERVENNFIKNLKNNFQVASITLLMSTGILIPHQLNAMGPTSMDMHQDSTLNKILSKTISKMTFEESGSGYKRLNDGIEDFELSVIDLDNKKLKVESFTDEKNNISFSQEIDTSIINLENTYENKTKKLNNLNLKYEKIDNSLKEIELGMSKRVNFLKNKYPNSNNYKDLGERVDRIKELQIQIFDLRGDYNSKIHPQSRDNKINVIQVDINKARKELREMQSLLPRSLKLMTNNLVRESRKLGKEDLKIEKTYLDLISINDEISENIENKLEIWQSGDLVNAASSGKLDVKINGNDKKLNNVINYFKKDRGYTEIDIRKNIPSLTNEQDKVFRQVLGYMESTHHLDKMNKQGFIGKYQMGVDALIDSGDLDKKSFETWKTIKAKEQGRNSFKKYNGWQRDVFQFVGSDGKSNWNLNRHPKGIQSFYENETNQEYALTNLAKRNHKSIDNRIKNNYEIELAAVGGNKNKVDSSTPKSINDLTSFEISGVLASAHLLGASGAYKALIRDKSNKMDANGTTSQMYYVAMFESVKSMSSDTIDILKGRIASNTLTEAKELASVRNLNIVNPRNGESLKTFTLASHDISVKELVRKKEDEIKGLV